jgi:hypothetical protein
MIPDAEGRPLTEVSVSAFLMRMEYGRILPALN